MTPTGGRANPVSLGADRAAAERERRRRRGTPLLGPTSGTTPAGGSATTNGGGPTDGAAPSRPRRTRPVRRPGRSAAVVTPLRRDDPVETVIDLVAEEAGQGIVQAMEADRPPRLAVVKDAPAVGGPDDVPPNAVPVQDPAPPAGPDGHAHLQDLLLDAVDFVRRRLEGDYAVDEFGFDPELTERVLLAVLRPVYRRWFRVDLRGAERIPADHGALLVGNHSGTVAWDALMTQVAVHDSTGGRFLRLLGADLVFATPVVGDVARRMGATLAASSDAERLLSSGELVGVWPEGFKGIGKNYRDRYRLQRFGRGGFVSAAIRTQVPIVPVSIVGAEETYPMLADVRPLARLTGAPYFPLTPTFPWLGPLGLVPLPSKWLIEFGEPIATDELDPGAAEDPMIVFEITDRVREVIQQTLYALLVQRGGVFLG